MDDRQQDQNLPDFRGRLVYLNVGAEAYPLESTTWHRFAKRWFLVGRMPDVPLNVWLADHEVAVAWDAVTSFVVFESVKQYLEHVARYKPSLLERLRR